MKKYLIAGLALLLACRPDQTDQQPAQKPRHQNYRIDKVQREQRLQVSEKKGFKLSYTAEPEPIPLNHFFRLRLLLQDAQSRVLDHATLTVEAGMPEHNHGMNVRPRVKPLGQGLYLAEGLLFHMAGYWEVTVGIESGGQRDQAIFGMTVVPQSTP